MKFLILLVVISVSEPGFAAKKKNLTQRAPASRAPANRTIEKVPKSLFLIKRAKINSAVGEPQFYPADAQLRTVINDQDLHNIKKYE